MKKFLTMFAFAAAIVFGAFTLASCGDDDEKSDPILTGTTWEGYIEYEEINILTLQKEKVRQNITLSFTSTTYRAGSLFQGPYSMSADNKTAYLHVDSGETICKISDDGKSMTLSNATTNVTGKFTKK